MIFEFKKKPKRYSGTEDTWYALTDGGYFKPSDVLSNRGQIQEVEKSIQIVKEFIKQCSIGGMILDG